MCRDEHILLGHSSALRWVLVVWIHHSSDIFLDDVYDWNLALEHVWKDLLNVVRVLLEQRRSVRAMATMPTNAPIEAASNNPGLCDTPDDATKTYFVQQTVSCLLIPSFIQSRPLLFLSRIENGSSLLV